MSTASTQAASGPVLVSLRASAQQADVFRSHLLKVIPVTRLAAGCRYSHTYEDPSAPGEFLLVQGWDSREQHQAYLRWRESTGDLAAFLGLLAKPPTVESFVLVDA